MEPGAYEQWLSGAATTESMEVAGGRLFERLGCGSCHQASDRSRGPSLVGLYGKRVQLASGSTVIADDAYLEASILNPAANVASGFQPIMPTFQGQIDKEDLFKLIAYIKSLKGTERIPVTP
jgi:cytochrome c oxidase subunit 2